MKRCAIVPHLAISLTLALPLCAETLSRTVAAAGALDAVDFQSAPPRVEALPDGGQGLHFDQPFNFRVDLKAAKVDPRDYDLVKLTVKADRGATLRVAVENHPRIGDISYWYVLDSMRGAFDWTPIWVDLSLPEEVKASDDHRSPWRAGMADDSKDLRGLQV